MITPILVTPPPQVLEAQQAKMSFFSSQRLNDILEQLITHYMVLSAEVKKTKQQALILLFAQELKLWEECPEEYAARETDSSCCTSFIIFLFAAEDSVGQLYQFSLRVSPPHAL